MIAVTSGIPALTMVVDSRMDEMTRLFRLPTLPMEDFRLEKPLEYYYDLADYTDFNKAYPERMRVSAIFFSGTGWRRRQADDTRGWHGAGRNHPKPAANRAPDALREPLAAGGDAAGALVGLAQPAAANPHLLVRLFRRAGNAGKNGFPYHLWLMCGMMPWLALNSAILGASASIQQAASIIRNVRIPLSIIPMKAVVRAYYEHLWTMAILLIALLLGGVPVTWHYLELTYYLAASWVLLIGAALLTSSLTAVFRDFGELLQPLMRLLFYVSSVVWAIDGLSPGLQRVMRLNPLVYIIEGYRKCLLYGEGFWSSPGQGAYFWLAALALLAAGCTLHMRLRNRFIDQL